MSTSEARPSNTSPSFIWWPQTASATSSEQPPANTPSRASERLLGRLEQVVAPVDRVAERALPRRQIVGAAGEQVEPLLEPAEDRLRREQLDARGRELDRERQAVEAAADPGHRGRVLVGELEARA